MVYRILASGDLHIGRTSTRLAEALPPETARAVTAWEALIEYATSNQIDLLILTGDIVDQNNRYWEAIGPLEKGLKRLMAAGIRTLAITGNHDYKVLPRLADSLKADGGFRLLGRDGQWQRETIQREGRPLLHIDGWSFPTQVVQEDPVRSYRPAPADGVPVLGVVHGDLGVPNSNYAPLGLDRLKAQPVAGWLLGHLHKPHLRDEGSPFILYPGSPQALDFGERGTHGPWQLTLDEGIITVPRQVPLSCCRYETLDCDVTGCEQDEQLVAAVLDSVRQSEQTAWQDSDQRLQALSLRIRLMVRPAMLDRLTGLTAEIRGYTGVTPGLAVSIDQLHTDVRPQINLVELTRGTGPLAAAAQLLHAMQNTPESEEMQALLGKARQRIDGIGRGRDYLALQDHPSPDDAAIKQLICAQLNFIIAHLLLQEGTA